MDTEIRLERSDVYGFGFSVFGGCGSEFPPVIYEVIENSPAAICGQIESGDVILEVNNKKAISLTTKEILKCLRLSKDSVTLKVRKDVEVKKRLQKRMTASREKDDKLIMGDAVLKNHSSLVHTNGNNHIPASSWSEGSHVLENHPESDCTRPRFEAFVMTGDMIINLNTKSSSLVPKSRLESLSFGQCSTPASPDESDHRTRNKAVKREASTFHSPVVEKKGTFSYSSHFVRTSKSEDHIQKASLSTVNIDVEDDMASSLNTLLDTNNSGSERIVWTYNAPHSEEGLNCGSSPPKYSSSPKLMSSDINGSEQDQSETESSSELVSALSSSEGMDQPTATVSEVSSPIDNISPVDGSFDFPMDQPLGSVSMENGVTKIVIDENKICVHVGSKCSGNWSDGAHPGNSKDGVVPGSLRVQANSDEVRSNVSTSVDDESDIDSLHSYHYSPKAVDMPSASRLAKRLYHLEGFKKSDVSRHLCKNNDFSRVVAEEYLRYFDFTSDSLDAALRKFLKQFCLIGETQERERVLAHFSKRYLDCNPGSFRSQDAVHTLTCALMLLNTDLHSEQTVGRRMTCLEFIENLTELNDGENFPREVLKALYHAIKTTPLEWAVDEEDDGPVAAEIPLGNSDIRQGMLGHNPFLEVPNPNCAAEYKKGYVMRKCCLDTNGKRTPLGKRGWKMFYITLRDLVLYLHKMALFWNLKSCQVVENEEYIRKKPNDEHGFRKNQLYDSLHNAIRIHHALATVADDYKKKHHVFRLQTADQAEYLFQTGDSKELQSWIDTVNYVAASLSSPPLAGAVGSQKKFQRPLLPVSHTKLNLREQLLHHEARISQLERELEEHLAQAPEKGTKSRAVHEFVEKDSYLQYEVKRFRMYAFLLRAKMAQYPDMETPLVKTSIGEVEEPPEKNEPSNAIWYANVITERSHIVKRCHSDRYSYRAAIYKNSLVEDTG